MESRSDPIKKDVDGLHTEKLESDHGSHPIDLHESTQINDAIANGIAVNVDDFMVTSYIQPRKASSDKVPDACSRGRRGQ